MPDEPARPNHLRVIDGAGEVAAELCPHCHETEMALRSERAKVTKLKNELARAMGVEPDATHVIEVLSFWRTTLDSSASIVAGSDNWKAVRARLRDTDAETGVKRFDVLKLKAAVIGMTLDDWHMARGQSHRRHPANAFRDADRVDRLIGKAIGFKRTFGTSALEIVDDLGGEGLRWLAERCSCGHTWLAHLHSGEAAQGGPQRCAHEDCDCVFDVFHAKVERYMREQDA